MTDAFLDFNHREQPLSFAEGVNALIDHALVTENDARPTRDYLGGSRLGDACARRLQYEYLKTPKDEGGGFSGQSLRIFALGHVLEDLAIEWLRMAGFDLRTRNRYGDQFGFSVAGGRVKGHADGVVVADLNAGVTPLVLEILRLNADHRKGIDLAVVTDLCVAGHVCLWLDHHVITQDNVWSHIGHSTNGNVGPQLCALFNDSGRVDHSCLSTIIAENSASVASSPST